MEWGWAALEGHISLPSLNLWLGPKHQSIPPSTEDVATVTHLAVAPQRVAAISTAIITVLGVCSSLQAVCAVCTLKPHISWWAHGPASENLSSAPKSLSGSSLGQNLFTPNTHSPADQRLKLPLNQDRTQWNRGCPTSPPSKRKTRLFLFLLCWIDSSAFPTVFQCHKRGHKSRSKLPSLLCAHHCMDYPGHTRILFFFFFKWRWSIFYLQLLFCSSPGLLPSTFVS